MHAYNFIGAQFQNFVRAKVQVSGVTVVEQQIIGIASNKGGQGKSTTAINLSAFFQRLAPTLLVDGDGIRTASKYRDRSGGEGLPFKVVSYIEMPKHIRDFRYVVIDTEANPSDTDFKDLALNCDFMVVPVVPETEGVEGLTSTLLRLRELGSDHFKVLLSMVPPPPRKDGEQLREMLRQQKIPLFDTEVPRLSTFDKAAAAGVPVYAVKDDKPERIARACAPYETVGKEILKWLENSHRSQTSEPRKAAAR